MRRKENKGSHARIRLVYLVRPSADDAQEACVVIAQGAMTTPHEVVTLFMQKNNIPGVLLFAVVTGRYLLRQMRPQNTPRSPHAAHPQPTRKTPRNPHKIPTHDSARLTHDKRKTHAIHRAHRALSNIRKSYLFSVSATILQQNHLM